MAKREVWVGIDVSKRRLDVALGVHGELLQVDNDAGGRYWSRSLVRWARN